MIGSDIKYNVIFKSDTSEDLENFLISYIDSKDVRLYVLDLSKSEVERSKNKIMIENFGFFNEPCVLRMSELDDFEIFKNLIKFDNDYNFFESNYLIFCFGGQLFDDTLDILIDEVNNSKCLTISPQCVDFNGNFYEFEEFNPNCFLVNKSLTKSVLDYCKSFSDFVKSARLNKMSMVMCNGMVFG